MLKLADQSLLRELSFIDGSWRGADDGTSFAVHDPSTDMVLGHVPAMGERETQAAIAACRLAQPQWAEETAATRSAVLLRWHALILANIDDLAAILAAESGKPLAEAKGEVAYGAGFLQWYAEEAKRVYGEVIPGHQKDKRLMVLRQPVGVVAAITPWNFPNAMITRKVAPALATGSGVVLKPSEETPFSALALAVLAERAGLPSGLFNIVTSRKSAEVGRMLCASPDVNALTFTGSTDVGRLLSQQCAPTIKKVGLELGGNAPFLVFDDADLDAAIEGALVAKFRNNGQTCVCANRFYVQAGIHDRFVARLTEATAKLSVGPGGNLGPLINHKAVEKVEAHIADAVAKGARIRHGGERHALGGKFFQPTVLSELDHTMRIASEETFGPVAAVFRFETDAEALDLANDSDMGLAAYVYTNDARRVWRVAEKLETGMVGVNTGLISTEVAPLGGIKQSGLGREGSRHGLDEYLNTKYVCFGGI
jgi:succinate-semialdehyde dehydrogenase/glutarate-semialdehyde dehydrogenase